MGQVSSLRKRWRRLAHGPSRDDVDAGYLLGSATMTCPPKENFLAATTGNERREQAFLALIRYAESNKQERSDAYDRRNGGSHFYNMHRHPGPKVKGEASSASGAYQITFSTYESGALPLIWDGQLAGAFSTLNTTWNSLPGGSCQLINEDEAEAYFRQQLGENQK